MKASQISLSLAMRQMRFFNERAGSTKNKNRFFARMWAMYPRTAKAVFEAPYEYGITDAEIVHRAKPVHMKINPLKS